MKGKINSTLPIFSLAINSFYFFSFSTRFSSRSIVQSDAFHRERPLALELKRTIDLPASSPETFQVYCSVNRTYERIIYSRTPPKERHIFTLALAFAVRVGAIYLRWNIYRAEIYWLGASRVIQSGGRWVSVISLSGNAVHVCVTSVRHAFKSPDVNAS